MSSDKKINELYVDGLRNLSFAGGVVRAELVRLNIAETPGKEKAATTNVETVQHIVMSPNGFIQATTAMNDLLKKLVDAGIVGKRSKDDKEGKSKN